jgi:hypothetical protein
MKLYTFRTVPLSIIRSFLLYTQQWYMSYSFTDSLRAGSGWNCVPSWSLSQAVYKTVWHTPLLCVQWKTADGGQRNCPKHVEFQSKNKFEKLVHLVGFIIRIMLKLTIVTNCFCFLSSHITCAEFMFQYFAFLRELCGETLRHICKV